MNEDSNLSVASDSQDGTHPVVINTLNGSSNVTTASATEESSASNTATTNGTSKGTWLTKKKTTRKNIRHSILYIYSVSFHDYEVLCVADKVSNPLLYTYIDVYA